MRAMKNPLSPKLVSLMACLLLVSASAEAFELDSDPMSRSPNARGRVGLLGCRVLNLSGKPAQVEVKMLSTVSGQVVAAIGPEQLPAGRHDGFTTSVTGNYFCQFTVHGPPSKKVRASMQSYDFAGATIAVSVAR